MSERSNKQINYSFPKIAKWNELNTRFAVHGRGLSLSTGTDTTKIKLSAVRRVKSEPRYIPPRGRVRVRSEKKN